MNEVLLSVTGLTKTFRSHWTFGQIPALQSVTFDLKVGESLGFLGHNGAGKTTTIKCILGLISRTAGEIRYDGSLLDQPDQRQTIGYLPELPYFYDHLTVEETLSFLAGLYGPLPGLNTLGERKKRVSETLEFVGLAFKRKDSVRSLSKGLQQRLGLAQAIIHKPKLLLLDEPFSGLDPIGRYEFRNILATMKEQGTTMMLSSHVLSDIELLCNRVTIMTKGTIAAQFSMHEIASLYGEQYILTLLSPAAEKLTSILNGAVSTTERVFGEQVHLEATFDNRANAESALTKAIAADVKVREYRAAPPTLESIFVKTVEQHEPLSTHSE